MTRRLTRDALPEIAAAARERLPEGSTFSAPEYDRAGLTPGIVHFGVGGFHRAHQARYLDELLSRGEARDLAICGMGVLPGDERMRDALAAQDHLYTLIARFPDGREDIRVIGSIVDYVWAPEDPAAAVERLAGEEVRIVSLTVTEGGYNINQVTHEYDLTADDVAADLADPGHPRTVFGLVVQALRLRRERGVAPFTILSCDNVQANGEIARTAFTTHARALDPELADWIGEHVSFPHSMVDRITPATTDADRAYVREQLGYEDAWPVVTEDFIQWVMEDEFTAGRPAYDDVGVQLVEDVAPYEKLKLRMLNSSHQGLCYFAHLAGYHRVDEAVSDGRIADFLRAYMRREAMPTLDPVEGIDVEDYAETLIRRFTNAHVKDTVPRLCAESSDRIPKWLVPVIRDNLRDGGDVRLSAAIVASWARYAEGTDERGEPIDVVDHLADRVRAAAGRREEDELAFLRDEDLFGDLAEQPRFTEGYAEALRSLHEVGSLRTLERLLD
ncbi:mannitol dehydrogenase family protein [Rothia sp. AR01]|uniref:Mannitol-1-phosphate 5-dehydrogenase n=1 Tax=Rothia santali TaxID=2949643 RepID=A0A9X2KI32_9MICC|nr:mannitol dehydrogenase family protein [Rothia santali]MCP3425424.1 mannitol dehydrogenase family protein [Rothia santali]